MNHFVSGAENNSSETRLTLEACTCLSDEMACARKSIVVITYRSPGAVDRGKGERSDKGKHVEWRVMRAQEVLCFVLDLYP